MSELAENIVDWEDKKFDPIKLDKDGNWILNPGAPFELTLVNADEIIAQKVRNILDAEETANLRKDLKLQEIFALNNLRINEIEDYKSKYKEKYLKDMENQKNRSKKFNILNERERYEILDEFRLRAIDRLYEKADCNFESLFEKEPEDINFDQELIREYGFDNIQTYLIFADNLKKVYVIPNDHFFKKGLTKLVELNLAISGQNLTKTEVLSTLTLKEMNLLLKHSEKEFKQKNKAIEYISTLEDVDEIISNNIAIRQLFKMKPLPEKFGCFDIKLLSDAQEYRREVINLLIETYNHSYESWKYLNNDYNATEFIVVNSLGKNACPCSYERPNKYTAENPPKVPFHIGCNCQVYYEDEDELNDFEEDFFDLSDNYWPEDIKFEPIKKDNAGNWILNPGALFQLTLLNADESFANKIRSILDETERSYLKKNNPLIGLFAGNNFRIKEIEDYKNKYKQQYLQQIKNQKDNSTEWLSASDKDRQDLLIEFKEKAIETLYEKADCNLVSLFENEPIDRNFDNELIEEFGFENLQTYLKFSDKLNEILIITNDMLYRTQFDELVRWD